MKRTNIDNIVFFANIRPLIEIFNWTYFIDSFSKQNCEYGTVIEIPMVPIDGVSSDYARPANPEKRGLWKGYLLI